MKAVVGEEALSSTHLHLESLEPSELMQRGG